MWTCLRSGDWCRNELVEMTWAERRTVEASAKGLGIGGLQWRAGERPSFTSLVARPCPFLAEDQGLASCQIYESRPYNCRRFMCGRDDTTERFDAGAIQGIPLRVLTSAALRADYAANQAAAQEWADSHGWSKES